MSHIIIYEALDIETIWDNSIAKPICIAITDKHNIKYCQTSVSKINEFHILEFLLNECKNNVIYYVHNLTFEIYCFLPYFNKYNIDYNIISSDKSVYSCTLTYKNKIIKMRCSYKLTLLSLKDLAILANVNNKSIFPYKILTNKIKKIVDLKPEDFNNNDDYNYFLYKYGVNNIDIFKILKDYCENDVYITKVSINKFWDIIKENGLKINLKILSAAKLSILNYFKNNIYIKKKIPLKYDRLLRPYYFGGRTEVFGNPKLEDGLILHFDWSGMYAQCMSEKVLGGEIYISNIIYNLDTPGFYYIEFYQNLEYPILPIKYNNKLMFMNGRFKGWYWFEEIILAKENGVEILKIEKMLSAQYYDYFIKDFVNINNMIRNKGGLYKQIGKNNNNTFYGRLGMNPERLSEIISNNVDINDDKYVKVIIINGSYVTYVKKEKSISNITIAASITSKARIKLYKGFREVIKNKGRLLYCDTDSIICEFNKNSDVLDKQFGEVYFDSKKDDTIIKDCVLSAPKTYALKYNNREVTKIKGFNSTPKYDEFKEKFYEKGYIITNNIEWNKKDMVLKLKNISKKVNLYNLDKRKWSSDLKDTYSIYVPYNNSKDK